MSPVVNEQGDQQNKVKKAAVCLAPKISVGAGGKCTCPKKTNWNDGMCKPNILRCKKGQYDAIGNCNACKIGYTSKMNSWNQKYCADAPWWQWFVLAAVMLLAALLLTLIIYGIFWCCQKFCGCCKQKKEAPKMELREVIVQAPRPQPVYREICVEPVPVQPEVCDVRIERGEPIITYGKQSVIETIGNHEHLERRHVETRHYSPEKEHDVTYRSNVEHKAQPQSHHNVQPQRNYASQAQDSNRRLVGNNNRSDAGQNSRRLGRDSYKGANNVSNDDYTSYNPFSK